MTTHEQSRQAFPDRENTIHEIDIVQIGDEGKHLSHFGIQDTMSVMGQLGLLPPPPS
ncbi:MAG: hypothetical protein ACRDH7_02505 [Actinomycetota bacterium]